MIVTDTVTCKKCSCAEKHSSNSEQQEAGGDTMSLPIDTQPSVMLETGEVMCQNV